MTSPAGRIRPSRPAPRLLGQVLDALPGDPAQVVGATDVQVTGVVSDNRAVVAGDVFVALPGAHVHGARFVADALARGAVAVVTDADGAAQAGAAAASAGATVVVVADPRAALGPLASAVHGEPAAHLATFAVTGTNGKTTTTYALDAVLRALGRTTGLVGTVETRSAGRVVPSTLTTPEAADLQALFAAMREDGVDALAMEVSSHAIALHRVDGIVYDVAGFTNLSQDHLDFHGTLEEYFAVKSRLFAPDRSRRAVVVVPGAGTGRAWALALLSRAGVPAVPLLVDGPEPGTAGWVVRDVRAEPEGQRFALVRADGRALDVTTSLPGAFNVANVALAVAMVAESGVPLDALQAALDRDGVRPTVPGRMELVDGPPGGPRTVVDFAHNPDALALALGALRPTTVGRLVVVFGATGERDAGKRPLMGRVAVEGADVVVVTDDDPHGEDAAAVRAAVLDGAHDARSRALGAGREVEVVEVSPRADAIRRAVLAAADDDTVLVAGRGHEVWQEIDGVNHPLDDRVEARAALAERADPDRKQDA